MNGETFRATVVGGLDDGTAIIYDFGYQDKTGGSVHLDTGTAAGNFQTLVQAKILAATPSNYVIRSYRFACVGPVGGPHTGEIGQVLGVNEVSTSGSPQYFPNEIAISMKRTTGYASKRDRGRIFFGPVNGDVFTTGSENGPTITNSELVQVQDLLKTALVTGGVSLTPVIVAADGTTLGHSIINASMGLVFVHLRSRRPRVGG